MADHMTAEQLREDLADKAQLYRSQALAMESLADDEIAEILYGFADCLEDIAARLSGMAAGWQPIETAPKDAKAVLVFGGGWDEPVIAYYSVAASGWRVCTEQLDVRCASYCYGGQIVTDEYFNPTHWHPLPAAQEPPHAHV